MNFEEPTDFEMQLSRLLAFVIMFERNIEQYKCKLAGSQQFHTRLAFQYLDQSGRGSVNADDIFSVFQYYRIKESVESCQSFLRKYSIKGTFDYDQFLKLIIPRQNKATAQHLMVKNLKPNSILPKYLQDALCELFQTYVKMTAITNSLKRTIQDCSGLNSMEIIQFFRKCIDTPESAFNFIHKNCSELLEIDLKDVEYLSLHVKSNNDLEDFTDMDIRELISAESTSIQLSRKTEAKMKSFYEPDKSANETTMNFLNKTYQKTQKSNGLISLFSRRKNDAPHQPLQQFSECRYQKPFVQFPNTEDLETLPQYKHMFIDNFLKKDGATKRSIRESKKQLVNEPPIQRFEDEFASNPSSLQSNAFVRY